MIPRAVFRCSRNRWISPAFWPKRRVSFESSPIIGRLRRCGYCLVVVEVVLDVEVPSVLFTFLSTLV